MTLQQGNQQLLFQLYHHYDEREARNIADMVMEEVTEWRKIDRVLNKQFVLSRQQQDKLQTFTAALATGKPVQYVLQNAWFCGLEFFVDERVLIPRPETEELVQWAVEAAKAFPTPGVRMLDIGTGSGCIPVALKKLLPATQVTSCDVSTGALAVARQNAARHHVDVAFVEADILVPGQRALLPLADIIVSNPPYIPVTEKETMHHRVTAHEPHGALFVPDGDPLLFYRAIIALAARQGPTVQVFVEIHEEHGDSVLALFSTNGFTQVTLRKDLQGRPRMIRAVR